MIPAIASLGSYAGVPKELMRREARVRMVVDVIPYSTTLPLCHDGVDTWKVPQGKHEITVYKSDVQKVLDKVEDQLDLFKTCEEAYETALKTHLERVFRRPINMDKSTWDADVKDAAYQFTETNPWAEFTRIKGRSMKPLRSAQVLDEVDPPLTSEEQTQALLIESFTKALSKAQKSGK